ncbi:MAG: hypothetical protein Q9198_006400 [Flavoplaca austrocitrina]
MPLRILNAQERDEMEQAKSRRRIGATNGPTLCSYELVQHIPGRGKGYRALHSIAPGTLILAEPPLFTVDNVEAHRISQATIDRINQAVRNLRPARRQQYRRLFQAFPRRRAHPDKEKFFSNNFQMTPTQGNRYTAGIFLKASRFNHSCIPNAYFNWNPDYTNPGHIPPGALTIYAIKHIDEDEENLVNYHSSHAFMQAAERQRFLRRDYNFTCGCPACQPGGVHDVRRVWMSDYVNNAAANQGNDEDQRWERFQSLELLVELLEQEGLEYPDKATFYGYLADMYVDMMNRNRNTPMKYQWLHKAREAFQTRLEAEIIALGEDSQETRNTLHEMQQARLL